MSLRRFRRAVALVFEITLCIVRFQLLRLSGPLTWERRVGWMQRSASRMLDSLGIAFKVDGEVPTRGLVVCNHLSYIDILVLSRRCRCFFVANI